MKNAKLLKIAGTCGILTPALAFTCIFSAIATYPQFSWVNNALSDLGVVPGATASLFNIGLVASGAFALVFSAGLFKYLSEDKAGRVGASLFAGASLALAAIGVFNESFTPTHFVVSVLFFVLMPVSLLVMTWAFALMEQTQMALFTFIVAAATAAPWILQLLFQYVPGVAIPEFVSALAGTTWELALSYKIIRAPAHSP